MQTLQNYLITEMKVSETPKQFKTVCKAFIRSAGNQKITFRFTDDTHMTVVCTTELGFLRIRRQMYFGGLNHRPNGKEKEWAYDVSIDNRNKLVIPDQSPLWDED